MVTINTGTITRNQFYYANQRQKNQFSKSQEIKDTFIKNSPSTVSFGSGKEIVSKEIQMIADSLKNKTKEELHDINTVYTYLRDINFRKADDITAQDISLVIERHLGISATDKKSQENILNVFKNLDDVGVHKIDYASVKAKELLTPEAIESAGLSALKDSPMSLGIVDSLVTLDSLLQGKFKNAAVDAGAMVVKVVTTPAKASIVASGAGLGAKVGGFIGGLCGLIMGGPPGMAVGAKVGGSIGGLVGGAGTYHYSSKVEEIIKEEIKKEIK